MIKNLQLQIKCENCLYEKYFLEIFIDVTMERADRDVKLCMRDHKKYEQNQETEMNWTLEL